MPSRIPHGDNPSDVRRAFQRLTDTFFDESSDVDHDATTNFVANEHVDHTAVSVLAGTGLSGGGTIDADRTLSLSHLGIESLTDPNADRMIFWDDGASATAWLAPDGTSIAISGTTLSVVAGGIDHGLLAGLADDDHTQYLLADGTRALSGNLSASAGVTIDGRDLSVDGAKLDGIEAGADVTDATNVAAAGAAMAGGAFHDGFSDYVANEHIDWTNASSSLLTSNNGSFLGYVGVGIAATSLARLRLYRNILNLNNKYGLFVDVISGTQATGSYNNRAMSFAVDPYADSGLTNSGYVAAVYGKSLTDNKHAGTLATMYGALVQVGCNTGTTGTINALYGYFLDPIAKAGTIDKFHCFHIGSPSTGATITEAYAIYDASGWDWALASNNQKLFFGSAQHASIYFDGTNFHIDPQEAGSGYLGVHTALKMISGHIYLNGDNRYILFGDANDAAIFYDGTDLIVDTQQVGTGNLNLVGGDLVLSANDIQSDVTTGTKIGTSTSQKFAFWNATPIVQPTGIADADGTLADLTTKFNSLLAKLEALGLLAVA